MNTSHISKYISHLLLTFVFIFAFGTCASAPEETLERIATETRRSLPLIMDEYTAMTDCELHPNRTLKFTYTIKGVYTQQEQQEMEAAMKKVLIGRLKERKEIEFYLVNNVRFEHVYVDQSMNRMMHVNIEALDYK